MNYWAAIVSSPTENNSLWDKPEKAGHTRFKEPHYFSTMQGAVKEAIRRLLCEKVAGDEITTLRQFVDEADRLKAEFKEIIEPLSVSKEEKAL